MQSASLILIILSAGLASQWLAWRLGKPAIVPLIASGILLGPVTGVVQLGMSQAEITGLIGLGVAMILFEGGMDLNLAEFRRAGHAIIRLTILGPPLAWFTGSMAAHWIGGLSWPVAWVIGSILVVTGPTVILPLLRQARLNKGSTALLKWEGIVNDPVGVLLAVLTFQWFSAGQTGLGELLKSVGAALSVAALLGGAGGWLIGWLFRRGKVPEQLKAPVLMVLVLSVYWASNQVQHEAGLLSVTVMGLILGNIPLAERVALQGFNRDLTVVIVSVLFIVIPSQLELHQINLLDLRIWLFVLAILMVVRPLTIGLATLGAPIRKENKLLLAWIAPRGIVAAATAGILGPDLVAQGHADADKLLPTVFLVILVTVLAHGLSIGSLARRLGLAGQRENGLLIVGASPWTLMLARSLKQAKIDVLLVDGVRQRLRSARMEGIAVFGGEILSDHAEHALETAHLSYLLAATDNDYYNALVCRAKGWSFGRHRTFQLAIQDESTSESKRLPLQQRGYIAFETHADYETLHRRMHHGWTIQTSVLTEDFDFSQLRETAVDSKHYSLLLAAISPDGEFRLYSSEHPFVPKTGWSVFLFAPPPSGPAGH